MALRNGRGRVRQHVRAHGVGPHLERILESATRDTSFDRHENGVHGAWCLEVLEEGEALDAVLPRLRDAARASRLLEFLAADRAGDAIQLVELLAGLASRGYAWARTELSALARADRGWHFGYPFGSRQILELDGVDGLRELVPLFGLAPENRGNGSELASLIDDLSEASRVKASDLLQELARHDPEAKHLLDAMPSTSGVDGPVHALVVGPHDLEDLIAHVKRMPDSLPCPPNPVPIKWIGRLRRLAPDHGPRLGEALVSAGTDARRWVYSQALSRVGFAGIELTPVFELLGRAPESLRRSLLRGLGLTRDPAIHDLARQRATPEGLVDGYVRLFHRNFAVGDEVMIERALTGLVERDRAAKEHDQLGRQEWDALCYALEAVGDRWGRPEVQRLRAAALELAPGVVTRFALASELHDASALPDWVAREVELEPGAEDEEIPWGAPPAG